MFFTSLTDAIVPDYQIHQKKREVLVENVRKDNREPKRGLILLFENFEVENIKFNFDSSFRYFSGIKNESSCVVAINFVEGSCKYSLYVPNCIKYRKLYRGHCIEPNKENVEKLKFDEINFLGNKEIDHDYLGKYFEYNDYENLLNLIGENIKLGAKIYTLSPKDRINYYDSRSAVDRIMKFLPDITKDSIVDITEIINRMRREKDIVEVEKISKALKLTALAHSRMAKFIYKRWLEEKARRVELDREKGVKNINSKWLLEREIQAEGERVFIRGGGEPAYESVVAGCRDAETLHYHDNSNYVEDQVLIDMGARFDGYCSDITRTYPAFGEFTKKQKELYSILLAAQKHVESCAKPGFLLAGSKDKEKNLTFFAREYLRKNGGLDKYMTHSVGHHIGLDIHDGTFYGELEIGNVFTIEPGIYGVPYVEEDGSQHYFSARIEDNYLVEKDGVRCLSDFIPKEPEDICEFMKNGLTLKQ